MTVLMSAESCDSTPTCPPPPAAPTASGPTPKGTRPEQGASLRMGDKPPGQGGFLSGEPRTPCFCHRGALYWALGKRKATIATVEPSPGGACAAPSPERVRMEQPKNAGRRERSKP